MAVQYSFVTRWQIKAPLQAVWDSIYQSTQWPGWWKGVLQVEELNTGDENGIGAVRRYTWKSVLPYTLSFNMKLTRKDDYNTLEGEAFGELEGKGTWYFDEIDGVTFVEYHWNVVTNKTWMNIFSPVLKPFFKLNHDVVMRWGAEGLSRKLNSELLYC